MGELNTLLQTLTTSMGTIMTTIVALVAVVIGGICVVNAVKGFQKQDYKSVALWAACAVGAFIISALMGANAFQNFGNQVGDGSQDINSLVSINSK